MTLFFVGLGLALVTALRFGAWWLFRKSTPGKRVVWTYLFALVLLALPVYLLTTTFLLVLGGDEARSARFWSLSGRICFRWLVVWMVIDGVRWYRARPARS